MAPKSAHAKKGKETKPPSIRRRQVAEFSLSPQLKKVEELLQLEKLQPSSIDLHTLGTASLSHASSSAIVQQKDCPYTICGWPKGENTNKRYQVLLSMADTFDVFSFLCKTSPELCLYDGTKFKMACLNHYLRRLMLEKIEENVASPNIFLGPQGPFDCAADVDYPKYLRWLQNPACAHKVQHESVIMHAENLLLHKLLSSGFDIPHGMSFNETLKEEALQHDEERYTRNISAHLFSSLLSVVKDQVLLSYKKDFPEAKRDVLDNARELEKKVLALEHLKAKIPSLGETNTIQVEASIRMIEIFLAEQVKYQQEVKYKDTIVLIPRRRPANKPMLQL